SWFGQWESTDNGSPQLFLRHYSMPILSKEQWGSAILEEWKTRKAGPIVGGFSEYRETHTHGQI
ncbi:MAG: hypothetical protein R3B74_14285, partial [Nitrospirales bacterium]|nr:hypothetical protein [Nitrospirales bacterium]